MENENKISCESMEPFNRLLDLEVEEIRENGLTAKSKLRPDFCNPYSSAHGGYVYALGHAAVALSAELCLKRNAVVVDASNQYESSLMVSPARVRTKLLHSDGEFMVFQARVLDGRGKLCLTQIITLKETAQPKQGLQDLRTTIIPATENDPADPLTGVRYPQLSVFFPALCHIYVMERAKKGMIYGADLFPDTCDAYGAAHGGMIYTCCDSVTGGSAAFLLEKRPVTISSSIHYLRSATVSPIKAEAKLIREGKKLIFYAVDITDGNGELVAVAQFVMQSVDYKVTNKLTPEYQNRAFQQRSGDC